VSLGFVYAVLPGSTFLELHGMDTPLPEPLG
jgi:hypothetical protein